MTAKTSTERVASLRQRRTEAGLSEVRGIWAPLAMHDAIRDQAAKTIKRAEKKSPRG